MRETRALVLIIYHFRAGRARFVAACREDGEMIGDIETMPAMQLDAALFYAGRGWPVFPCSPNDKRPLVGESRPGAGDAGLYRATQEKAQILTWWKRWPDALIGVPTGERIGAFVVDLDPADRQSADDLLEELRIKVGGKLPPCPLTRTPRGGLHIWFKMPASITIGNRANILKAAKDDAKIDIRGTGGYVILPPSKRRGPKAVKEGCDGITYQWEEDAGLDDLDLPEPPAALILLIVSKDRSDAENEQPPATPRPLQASRTPNLSTRERQYALSAFDAEIRDVETTGKGQRNAVLNNAALKLGSLVAAGALSESIVRSALENASISSGLVKDDGWKAVRATINSGFKAGFEKPRDLSEAALGPSYERSSRLEPPPSAYDEPETDHSGGGSHNTSSNDDGGDNRDPREVVRLKVGRLPEAIRDIEKAMIKVGPGPTYQRSGELVHIAERPIRRSDGTEEIQEVVTSVEPAAMLCEWARSIRC